MLTFPDKGWITNFMIIRLLRFFKFFKFSHGLLVVQQTLEASWNESILLVLILLIPLALISSLLYAFENSLDEKTDFDSIPHTCWWTISTMMNLGYGELSLKTWPGKLTGILCAIINVLIFALPISVIGNKFNLYYSGMRAYLRLHRNNRRTSGYQ